MATWKELRSYISSNYKLMEGSTEEFLRMGFNLDGRSQLVFVQTVKDPAGEQWVQISSIVGNVPKVDLRKACSAAARLGIGGIIVRDGMDEVFLSHSVPLKNIDINEFEDPLSIVCLAADLMEKEFTSKDEY